MLDVIEKLRKRLQKNSDNDNQEKNIPVLSVDEQLALQGYFNIDERDAVLSEDYHSRSQNVYYDVLCTYFDEFPVLKINVDDLFKVPASKQINFCVEEMDDCDGYRNLDKIAIRKELWESACERPILEKSAAATFWHEMTHYLQEQNLMISRMSKRCEMVYRQFIEAEAMSYSNLISPRNKFEKHLYEALRKKVKIPLKHRKNILAFLHD